MSRVLFGVKILDQYQQNLKQEEFYKIIRTGRMMKILSLIDSAWKKT